MALYVGANSVGYPEMNPQAVLERFRGNEQAHGLLAYAEATLRHVMGFPVDWTVDDAARRPADSRRVLVAGALNFEKLVRRAHPELSDIAVAALKNYFTWIWR